MNDELTVQRRSEMTNLVNQLKDCQQLVEKCTHLSFWKYHKINFYTEKLKVCNERLNGFVTRVMVADIWEVTLTNRGVKYECSVPEPPKFTVGWTEPVGELKQKLLQEELPVIGICGAGGYGKSTLAKKLCEQVKGKFERISYISIPRSADSPTEKNEVEPLDWIGPTGMFSKLWDDLVGGSLPKFGSADGAREQLKQCLNKRKTQGKGMLVVLDGVLSDSMLERLVIGTPGLKTLVTSREELNGVNWSYRVQQLSMKDAMDLFRHHALLQGPTSEYVDEELVEQIVKGCNCHPLALEVIGKSLKNAEIGEWRSKAESLQNAQIFDEYEKILRPLYTSLQDLTPTERECFMDLSSFPNNKRIRAAALMDMWVHTRGQNEDRSRAYNILMKLADRHLIELFKRTRNETTDLDKSFGDLFVAQHDLLNELAVYVSRKEMPNTRLTIKQGDILDMISVTPQKFSLILKIVRDLRRLIKGVIKKMVYSLFGVGDETGRRQTEIRRTRGPSLRVDLAQIVSIHRGESINLERIDVPFPRVEVLILCFSCNFYCLPRFMNWMGNLKVLIIANDSMGAAVLSGPLPSGSLKSLRAVRLEKILLPISCTLMKPFKGVQKLSMVLCKVNEVLEIGPGWDIQIMFPDITELEIDYCDGLEKLPTAVCNIVNLQELSITNCHDLCELPEEIGSLSKLEVLRLSACTSLESLPDSFSGLRKLRFLDLFCCSRIKDLPNNIGVLHNLEKIDFRRCFANLPDALINLEGLRDVICDEDVKTLWEESVKTKLRRLRVHGCKDLVSLNFLK
ncbi:putative disease resistance protein At5g47280 isoform X2 [Nymphaea colorata]|nr:putative disease resistance protein At5g47280 isoform X2 [Nymphaea colorata]